ncbi:hypothetical protein BJV77DRAFT_1071951 [Russula vinacea]|nr:hypothetical protein BJV77DRAFT_1071951 [Russula vinacea]
MGDDVPVEAVNALLGVYGQLMMVIAGPLLRRSRSQKRVEAHPAPRLWFDLALSAEDIVPETESICRPVIASYRSAGPQLPLILLANTD